MITGQKPIKARKQGKFQIVNVIDMMRPLTKSTRQVSHGEHAPAIVREAFRLAAEERPGAVHIELPEDVAAETVDEPHLFDVVAQRIPYAGRRVLAEPVDYSLNHEILNVLLASRTNPRRLPPTLQNEERRWLPNTF